MIEQRYVLSKQLGRKVPVQIVETPGSVIVHCSSDHFTPAAVAAMNNATETMLAGGHWFQLWGGQVYGRDTTEGEDDPTGPSGDASS